MKQLAILFAFLVAAVGAFAQSGDPLPPFTPAVPVCTAIAPVNGTNEVQTFTISTLTSGTIQFGFQGKTANLSLSGTEADNAAISAEALVAIGSMATTGTGNLSVSTTGTGARAIAVTFTNNLGKLNVAQMTAAVLAGSLTVTPATSTPGVTADGRNTPKGTLLIDKADGALYINTGAPPAPTWTKVSP